MINDTILTYLKEIYTILKKVLKHNLVGVYVHGSIVFDDFQTIHSDLDLLAITSTSLQSSTKEQLKTAFNQCAFPCPAAGIELTIIHQNTASHPAPFPIIELALSTEETKLHQIKTHFIDTDLLIDLSICRKFGKTLEGPPPQKIISEIP